MKSHARITGSNLAQAAEKLGLRASVDEFVIVVAALEELDSAVQKFESDLGKRARQSRSKHVDEFLDLLAELKELFDHLGGHCEEASQALTRILDRVERDSGGH